MEIISFFWQQYLYIPLFNLLIWLYLNYSNYNLGVAVIILTVILRIVLLPFTVLDESGKIAGERLRKEIKEIEKDYAKDPIKKKLMIRRHLKKKRVRPWAKAVVLGVQLLVLVLLYQVFIGGINTEQKLHLLYPGILRPDFINTKFLWFDIAKVNLVAVAVVCGYLFAQILINSWDQRQNSNKREQIYALLFPAFVFLLLAFLPSVKCIFILTSLVFSTIISVIVALIRFTLNKAPVKAK